MGISIDITFAIQIASFLVLWVVLRRLLFEPMLQVLAARESRTRGSHEAATTIQAQVESTRADYEQRVLEARERALAELEETRKLTTAEERTVLGAARDQAAARLALARLEISRQVDAARALLNRDATALANQLAEKVIGRSVG